MLPAAPLTRLRLPAAPAPPPRAGFPWLAVLAPVAVSLALWAFTGSALGLAFAVLGPAAALAALADGARSRRRAVRAGRMRLDAACDELVHRIDALAADERARLRGLCARPDAPGWADGDAALAVCVGTGRIALPVELDGGALDASGTHDDAPVPARLAEVRERAARTVDGPLVLDAGAGLGIAGPVTVAAAVARAVAVQLAARLSPAVAELVAPADEEWASELPHPVRRHDEPAFRWRLHGPDERELVVAWAARAEELPLGCGPVVVLDGGECADPLARTRREAAAGARELTARAAGLGIAGPGSPPVEVPLAVLLADVPGHPGLAAPIGRDAEGPVVVDLVADGPHALVAGTTGAGKSELLVSWVLGMAHGRSPARVAFLLIDFKGGAAFAQLGGLPHVVATLSDLEPRLTRRAVESLRAELIRRERHLAEAGARSIDELPEGALARLVIVVDEFAALVSAGPELHDVFADVAARGRSLGLHLLLCTQRPTGVVRDVVLANIGLRLSLRVTDRGESLALLGDPAAALLPAEPRGRAILARDGDCREFQVALAAPSDTARIAAADREAPGAPAPWCEPLPHELDHGALPPGEEGTGLGFGLLDLPAEQRQPVAGYDPVVDGSLLVIGAPGSGVTTALTTIASAALGAGLAVEVLPADPADAWAALSRRRAPTALLVIDRLDVLLERFGPDERHEFSARLGSVLRAGPGAIVAGVRRLDGEAARLAGLFGSRLLLRLPSRDEHLLAGGDPERFDPARPPGSGIWRGAEVQVARVRGGVLPPARTPAPVRVTPRAHPVLAVVAARPATRRQALEEGGWRVAEVGADPADRAGETGPVAHLGDPDAWHADWALLTRARREWPIALFGCTTTDHRALLRDRGTPPPLGPDPAECWLVLAGDTVRAVLGAPIDAPRTSESEAGREIDH